MMLFSAKAPFRAPRRSGSSECMGNVFLRFSVLHVLLWASAAMAQDQQKNSLVRIHGFLLGDLTVRTNDKRPAMSEAGKWMLREGRLRLDVSGASDSGKAYFQGKGDALYDSIGKKLRGDLREGYAGYSAGKLDVRGGRQIITWGVGDLLFINDVFPKDWESFFSGRPMEYLKLGIDGLDVRYSGTQLGVEFVAIPSFTPDKLPSAATFVLFNPFSSVPHQNEEKPADHAEIALRVHRKLREADVSLYAYRGHWRTPGIRPDNFVSPSSVTRFYPKLAVFGASAQKASLGGVISLEAGYYDSRQDRRGNDPTVPNSQWRVLTAYQRELSPDFTVAVQTYGEFMSKYAAYRNTHMHGSPAEDHVRGVASVRVTRFFGYQTWKLSLFAGYGITASDYLLQPEVSRKVSDRFSISIGGNALGGGNETAFFGQFKDNDNFFVRARYDF